MPLFVILCRSGVGDPPEFQPNEYHNPGYVKERRYSRRRATSDTPKICDDLASLTCTPGPVNDGTGEGYSSDQVADKLRGFKEKLGQDFSRKFLEVLQEKPSDVNRGAALRRFRSIAISGTGQLSNPYCEKGETYDEQKCNETISKSLADLALRRVLPSSKNASSPGANSLYETKLENIDSLIHNPTYGDIEAEMVKKTRESIVDKDTAKKLEETVPKVKDMIVALLKSNITDPKLREALVDKVRAITYEGNDCSALSRSGSVQTLNGMLIPNAFYDPLRNSLNICNGLLMRSSSVFMMVQTIAHEIAHSFDPCSIALDPEDLRFKYSQPRDIKESEDEFPFKGLLACLRSDSSVAAKRKMKSVSRMERVNRPGGSGVSHGGHGGHGPQAPEPPEFEPSELGVAGQGSSGSSDSVHAPGPDSTETSVPIEANGKGAELSPFCTQGDQIGEAFADRIAAEVLPAYISANHPELSLTQLRFGYSNVFRGNCDNYENSSSDRGFDEHPEIKARVNRILLPQPDIRKQMGCPEEMAGVTNCPIKKGENA